MKWKIPWLQVHVVLIFKVVFFSCANFLCPPTSIVVPRSQGLFRRWPKGSRPMGKRLTLAEYFTYIVSSNNYFPHCNLDNRINKFCGRKLCTGHPMHTDKIKLFLSWDMYQFCYDILKKTSDLCWTIFEKTVPIPSFPCTFKESLYLMDRAKISLH